MGILHKTAQYRAYKEGVVHTTLNPKGPGAVRIHLIPPKWRPFSDAPYVMILNGYYILPLGYSWAILLRNFIREVNVYDGRPINEAQMKQVMDKAVSRTKRVYYVKTQELQEDLQEMLDLLYGVALADYVKYSGDTATGRDLWPVVKRQVEVAREALDPTGIYDNALKPSWLVFDWKSDLNRDASIQGLMTFAVDRSYELARMLGTEKEVSDWPKLTARMKSAARNAYYDRKSGLVLSGPDKQASYLSQVWMVLSGTLSVKEGARALSAIMESPDACRIGSPYAYHYFIEALIQCGLEEQARTALIDYWGGMVHKGADTFWEVYDPEDDFKSPYGFFPINSYCHAWSCTPVYFINKYPEVFQR